MNSLSIRKLVADDGDYLMDLALAEIIENFGCLAKSVARLGKRCADLTYHRLEHVFDDPINIDRNWFGWGYRSKKMERKIKKMERFAAVTAQLHHELEVLAELEQSLRRMQGSVDLGQVKLLEFQQKVMNSLSIRKLVADDGDYLMDLALAEIIENFGCLAKSVARLGKRCADLTYHRLEHVFDDPINIDRNWFGWGYRSKKMERKIKKMERFAAVTAQLHHELEVLAELEQSLRRMQGSVDLGQNLLSLSQLL
ncbi:hypothetical protein LOK49_LG09G00599 [Camellia lanceoleosa]|uniref:Uncharacterized protein n=1 Tax=Camellia lanceoleosa TaxID=1840588 RepID=A0ACC0GL34_9ERIC|nr:hypothetical protein LOK49_LG09G00599 [Camellia lanceoleosa]